MRQIDAAGNDGKTAISDNPVGHISEAEVTSRLRGTAHASSPNAKGDKPSNGRQLEQRTDADNAREQGANNNDASTNPTPRNDSGKGAKKGHSLVKAIICTLIFVFIGRLVGSCAAQAMLDQESSQRERVAKSSSDPGDDRADGEDENDISGKDDNEEDDNAEPIKGFEGAELGYIVNGEGEDPENWDRYSQHLYLEHDGLCYPVCRPEYTDRFGSIVKDNGELDSDYVMMFGCDEKLSEEESVSSDESNTVDEYDVEPFPIRPSAGDRIITTDDIDVISLIPIGNITKYSLSSGSISTYGLSTYDEIAGESLEGITDENERLSSALEIVGSYGVEVISSYECRSYPDGTFDSYSNVTDSVMVSDKPLEISVGKYSGTSWKEETLRFDCPSVFKMSGEQAIRIEVAKTHDGYFYFDLDNIATGEYILFYETASIGGGYDHYIRVSVV